MLPKTVFPNNLYIEFQGASVLTSTQDKRLQSIISISWALLLQAVRLVSFSTMPQTIIYGIEIKWVRVPDVGSGEIVKPLLTLPRGVTGNKFLLTVIPSFSPAVIGWILVYGDNENACCVVFCKPRRRSLRCSSLGTKKIEQLSWLRQFDVRYENSWCKLTFANIQVASTLLCQLTLAPL